MVFTADEGEIGGIPGGDDIRFTRVITSQGSTVYKVNGKEQSWEAYSKLLEELNIITKARNFLVFQVRRGPRCVI
jgi:chromosome segregation ATPase